MSLSADQIGAAVRPLVRATITELPNDTVREMVNMMIDQSVADNLYQKVIDESLTLADDTYEYPLTGGELGNLRWISGVFRETETAGLFEAEHESGYHWTLQGGTTPYISFDRGLWAPDSGRKLRVVGGKAAARVTSMSELIDLPHTYMTWTVAEYAHASLSGSRSSLADWHTRMIVYCRDKAELARAAAIRSKIPPHAKHVPGRA